jgi:hypothetical protein
MRMDLVPTTELREMAFQVLHVEERDCWPGSGEVPQWVRAIGEQLELKTPVEYVPKVCERVRHEVLRRFVCEPQRLQ